ncbi:MAG TPA: anhydro-N-acetylmuramic acid kinase, partial [Casimicrobiaceae bacterium]|nr:anhydro-N-acetylmuramic acid kinase [Casimicrobiaceae bacterium]
MKPRSTAVERNMELGVGMIASSNISAEIGPQHSPRLWRALGLMSGTSLDGIDAAIIETDGQQRVVPGPAMTIPYPEVFRERLRSVLGGVGRVAEVEDELTRLHAHAVEQFVARYPETRIDIVGLHGHTILHR